MRDPEREYKDMLEKLIMICKQKKVSQYYLAKHTGISTSSISALMKGETRPYIYTLLIICNALGITLRDLLEDNKVERDKEERWLLAKYRLLTPEKKKLLKVYVDMLQQYEEGSSNII